MGCQSRAVRVGPSAWSQHLPRAVQPAATGAGHGSPAPRSSRCFPWSLIPFEFIFVGGVSRASHDSLHVAVQLPGAVDCPVTCIVNPLIVNEGLSPSARSAPLTSVSALRPACHRFHCRSLTAPLVTSGGAPGPSRAQGRRRGSARCGRSVSPWCACEAHPPRLPPPPPRRSRSTSSSVAASCWAPDRFGDRFQALT